VARDPKRNNQWEQNSVAFKIEPELQHLEGRLELLHQSTASIVGASDHQASLRIQARIAQMLGRIRGAKKTDAVAAVRLRQGFNTAWNEEWVKGAVRGNAAVKVEPRPSSLSRVSVPPWALVSSAAMPGPSSMTTRERVEWRKWKLRQNPAVFEVTTTSFRKRERASCRRLPWCPDGLSRAG